MTPQREPPSELDLHAYVDDQLDMARRVELEDQLSHHPELAARVMADLRTRDALRFALAVVEPAPAASLAAARQLGRSLARARFLRRFRGVGVAAALVALGWLANDQVGPLAITEGEAASRPPAFVEDALRSHHTALLRARLPSQPEAPDFHPEEILAATRIAVPRLPEGWRVLDAQLFPSREGPSIVLAIEVEGLGAVSLVGVRVQPTTPVELASAPVGAEAVAYWQADGMAFVLTGEAGPRRLERAARDLGAR